MFLFCLPVTVLHRLKLHHTERIAGVHAARSHCDLFLLTNPPDSQDHTSFYWSWLAGWDKEHHIARPRHRDATQQVSRTCFLKKNCLKKWYKWYKKQNTNDSKWLNAFWLSQWHSKRLPKFLALLPPPLKPACPDPITCRCALLLGFC